MFFFKHVIISVGTTPQALAFGDDLQRFRSSCFVRMELLLHTFDPIVKHICRVRYDGMTRFRALLIRRRRRRRRNTRVSNDLFVSERDVQRDGKVRTRGAVHVGRKSPGNNGHAA